MFLSLTTSAGKWPTKYFFFVGWGGDYPSPLLALKGTFYYWRLALVWRPWRTQAQTQEYILNQISGTENRLVNIRPDIIQNLKVKKSFNKKFKICKLVYWRSLRHLKFFSSCFIAFPKLVLTAKNNQKKCQAVLRANGQMCFLERTLVLPRDLIKTVF